MMPSVDGGDAVDFELADIVDGELIDLPVEPAIQQK
jgi:hypothetical protein